MSLWSSQYQPQLAINGNVFHHPVEQFYGSRMAYGLPTVVSEHGSESSTKGMFFLKHMGIHAHPNEKREAINWLLLYDNVALSDDILLRAVPNSNKL